MGEMSIFWCISMLNNVKSYKKINEKAQMANFSVFAKGSQLRKELFAKNMENWRNYHGTMGKGTSRAFRKCCSF